LLAWLVPSLFYQADDQGLTPIEIAKDFGCNLEKFISLMNIAKESTQELMKKIENTIELSPSGHIKALTQEALYSSVNNNLSEEHEDEDSHIELAIKEQNKQHQTYKKLFKMMTNVMADEKLSWHTGAGGKKITVKDSKGQVYRKKVSDHGETIWEHLQAVEKQNDLESYKFAWSNITLTLPSKPVEEVEAKSVSEKPSLKKRAQEFFGQRSDRTWKFYETLVKYQNAPTQEGESVIEQLEAELRSAFS
jgi:hypothetical protein